jgi:hypothetical protein
MCSIRPPQLVHPGAEGQHQTEIGEVHHAAVDAHAVHRHREQRLGIAGRGRRGRGRARGRRRRTRLPCGGLQHHDLGKVGAAVLVDHDLRAKAVDARILHLQLVGREAEAEAGRVHRLPGDQPIAAVGLVDQENCPPARCRRGRKPGLPFCCV